MATSCPERGMGVLEVVGGIQPLWCGEKGATGKGCLVGWFESVHHRPPRKLLPPSTTSPLDWKQRVVKGRNKAWWEGAHVFSNRCEELGRAYGSCVTVGHWRTLLV